jgi:hypothetical protein
VEDRLRFAADRNSPQKHVWRARIVLVTAAGLGTVEVMRRTGKSKTCVWRWQERFMQEGTEGLLRDKTRPSRIPSLGPQVAERVIALTQEDRFQTNTIGGAHLDDDILAHPPDSHPARAQGIPFRILPSGFIHSHVRHYQMQASELVACLQAPVLGSSGQGRRHGRRNDG